MTEKASTRSDNGELPAPHAGLPVAGYRPQSDAAVQTVNAVKQIEEHVLRLLDEIAEDTELMADRRWFSIGRTAIEQGFMAVNRSIFKPGRVEIAELDDPIVETGWVIERGDSSTAEPVYYQALDSYGRNWTSDHALALRFARKIDADGFASSIIGYQDVRVCEHQWS